MLWGGYGEKEEKGERMDGKRVDRRMNTEREMVKNERINESELEGQIEGENGRIQKGDGGREREGGRQRDGGREGEGRRERGMEGGREGER